MKIFGFLARNKQQKQEKARELEACNDEIYAKLLEAYKNLTARNCAHLEFYPWEQAEMTDSKFGGAPYLPVGEAWPCYEFNGVKMPFVCQLKLSECKIEGFPESGMLEIFGKADDVAYNELVLKLYPENVAYQEGLPTRLAEYDPDYDEHTAYLYDDEPLKVRIAPWVDYPCFDEFNYDEFYARLLKAANIAFGENFEELEELEAKYGQRPLGVGYDMVNLCSGVVLGGYPQWRGESDFDYARYDTSLLSVNGIDGEAWKSLNSKQLELLSMQFFGVMVPKAKLQAGELDDVQILEPMMD